MKTNRRMQRSSGKPGSLRPRSKTQQLISDLVVVIVNFLWMVEIVGWLSFCPLCFFLWRFLVHTFFQAKARVSYNLWETGHLQNNQTFASPVFNLKWTCIFIMIFQVRNVLFWVDCHFHVPWNHQGQTARSYVVGLGQRSNTDPQAAHPPPKKKQGEIPSGLLCEGVFWKRGRMEEPSNSGRVETMSRFLLLSGWLEIWKIPWEILAFHQSREAKIHFEP